MSGTSGADGNGHGHADENGNGNGSRGLDQPWPPWREAVEAQDDTAMARPPENRRQAIVKLLWIGVWMLYLGSPVSDLADGGHGVLVTTVAAVGLAAFVASYLTVVFFRTNTLGPPERWVYGVLGAEVVLSLALSATLGKDWLVLFVYATVASGAALPPAQSRWAVPALTGLLAAVGVWVDSAGDLYPALVIPALLGGFAMVGIRQLIRTMRELREARETVAHLAANEERLRLARDLHDLLGHSLSLITLKSELAGRMLPDRPLDAAEQVADIEQVSRQALVDVREAVSGYRRPRLADEIASARSALASAGIAARIHHPERVPGLTPDGEGALAWALREAVTNVVRHSGATTCVVALASCADDERGTVPTAVKGWAAEKSAGTGTGKDAAKGVGMKAPAAVAEGDPLTATLTVSDDGHGPKDAGPDSGSGSGPALRPGHLPGNGLTGLSERILLAGGALTTARSGDGGFVLKATVPISPMPVAADLSGPGE